MKDLKTMSTDELLQHINSAECLLKGLRRELDTRTDTSKVCGHRWSTYTCTKAPGHEDRHSQGFIIWPRR